MDTRHIDDDESFLNVFRKSTGLKVAGMAELDDQPKVCKGCIVKEGTCPLLRKRTNDY